MGPAAKPASVKTPNKTPQTPARVKGTKTTRSSEPLAATGVSDGRLGFVLLAAALALLRARRTRVVP